MPPKNDPTPGDDKPMSAMERYAAMRDEADKPKNNLSEYIRRPGNRKTGSDTTYTRRAPERAEFPRKVRAGLKVGMEQWPPTGLSPFAAPLAELIVRTFPAPVIHEAFKDYARRGQTRQFKVEPGGIAAEVQGRRFKAYQTRVSLTQVDADQWDKIIDTLVSDPLLNARLLSGEFPSEINAVFEQHGAALSPGLDEELTIECDCKEQQPCKHGACVAILLTEAIHSDPFILLELRGIAREQLVERLRQRRAVTASSTGLVPAFSSTAPEAAADADQPLESDAASFWNAGNELRDLEIPIKKPEISYPLLRRLGPTPFEEGKFPLVGLLATCYELISAEALRLESEPDTDPS